MWVIVLALVAGLAIGLYTPFTIPLIYARYLSIAVLAALDSAFGALRASTDNKYNHTVFVSGFFTNALLAAGLTYLGERLGVDLYLAAVVAMGIRIFQNLGIIRRYAIERWGVLTGRRDRKADG